MTQQNFKELLEFGTDSYFTILHVSCGDKYYIWPGTFGSGLILVTWVDDEGIPCALDYKKAEVLGYLESGQWRVLE